MVGMIGYRGIVAYAPRGLKRAGGCGMKEEEKCSSSFEGYNHMRLVINSAVTISRTTSKQASKHSKQAGAGQGTAGRAGQINLEATSHCRLSNFSTGQSTVNRDTVLEPHDNTTTCRPWRPKACHAFPHPSGLRDPACAPSDQHFRRATDQRLGTTHQISCVMRQRLTFP